jgi:hypothetical protein
MKERMSLLWIALVVLVIIAVAIIGLYMFMNQHVCDSVAYRGNDGSLTLQPSGRWFPDMNAFQQWWSTEHRGCALPVLKGSKKVEVLENESGEQTYAHTPIYKVDDYEFSRVFGYERGGRMEVPRQDFNIILNKRAFDWADKPLSSDERRAKYKGLTEGFTAEGDLTSVDTEEIRNRYGERDKKEDCHRRSPEDRKVAAMVARVYASDPDYEPVLTKVGPHQWEVNELKPLKPNMSNEDVEDNRIVDTSNDAVDIAFDYRQAEVVEHAIDPYFPDNQRPYQQEAASSSDPYRGVVPGLERMFGPTFDHVKWY